VSGAGVGGPGEGGAVGVGRVGRGQGDRGRLVTRPVERAQPVHRAGGAELGGAQPLDEVAASAAAGLLEGREHLVDRREPAGDPLADDGAAGHDAVPLEQVLGGGVGALRGVGVALRQHVLHAAPERRPDAFLLRCRHLEGRLRGEVEELDVLLAAFDPVVGPGERRLEVVRHAKPI
jgi:hypothetical protein